MSCTTSSATQSSMASMSPRLNAVQKRSTSALVRSAARAPSMIMRSNPLPSRKSVLPACGERLPRDGLPGQAVEIDVAARQDHADAPACKMLAMAQDRGEGDRRRWLDDDLEPFPEEAHCRDRLAVARQQHPDRVPAQQRQIDLAERGAQAVADRVRFDIRDAPSGLERGE